MHDLWAWRVAIDCEQVSGSSLIQCYAPATGEALGRINPSTADGIDRAIAKAKAAQVQWAQVSFRQRRKVLKTMLKFILENQEAIARVACLDSGKTMVDAALGEILVTVEKLRWTLKHGEKSLKAERRDTNFLMMYKWSEVVYEPLGVVAACVSWKWVTNVNIYDTKAANIRTATRSTTSSAP
jgi:acyl-CoA reductase-like NAD-dependent aldehyde dehydrogenase